MFTEPKAKSSFEFEQNLVPFLIQSAFEIILLEITSSSEQE